MSKRRSAAKAANPPVEALAAANPSTTSESVAGVPAKKLTEGVADEYRKLKSTYSSLEQVRVIRPNTLQRGDFDAKYGGPQKFEEVAEELKRRGEQNTKLAEERQYVLCFPCTVIFSTLC